MTTNILRDSHHRLAIKGENMPRLSVHFL